jgi:hypothetical protein
VLSSDEGGLLPLFNGEGFLPAGDYELTLEQLERSRLVTGLGIEGPWDGEWRLRLVKKFATVARQLARVGVTTLYANGSFVSDKPHPADIDAYFLLPDRTRIANGELVQSLNSIDPYMAWSWRKYDLRYDPMSGKTKFPLWHRYRVDIFPHWPGAGFGVVDKHGNELEYPAAFRRTREGTPKGIVKIGGL